MLLEEIEPKTILYIYDSLGELCLKTVSHLIKNMKHKLLTKSKFEYNDEKIKKINPDLILIIEENKSILKCETKIVGFHPAKLPKYRGDGVFYYLIKDGIKNTHCTMYYYDDQIDHGDIIAQREMYIEPDENSETLREKVVKCYVSLIYDYLQKILDGRALRSPQNHSLATYCDSITPKKSVLNLNQPGYIIEREVRALVGYKGAYIYTPDGGRLYLKSVSIDE